MKSRGLGFEEPSHNPGYFSCHVIDVNTTQGDDQRIFEVKNAPKELEEGGQSTIDDLRKINQGTEENERPTFVSASLTEEERKQLEALLREFKDCFAWDYKEMPGLDPKVAVHKFKIRSDAKPIKQAPRRMRVELEEQVTAETRKLIEAGFIREEENQIGYQRGPVEVFDHEKIFYTKG